MALIILYKQGWPSDIIEQQLAHSEQGSINAFIFMHNICRTTEDYATLG
jgi:hypothetical protein